jgi:hypothetical protein
VSTTLTVAVPRADQAPLAFPERCASCGARASTESTLAVTRLVTRGSGRQTPVALRWQVPHCELCARATKATFLAQLLPFLAGFVAVGVTAFVATWMVAARTGLDDVGQPDPMRSLVVAAAAALAGGLAGGLVAEVAVRVLLAAVFGSALLQAPLLVGTIFTDADYVAGVRARPSKDATEVTLTFGNDDVAREFAAANAGRVTSR